MTRSYGSKTTRRARRSTQPIRIVRVPRDPSITPMGFTCFRLVRNLDSDPGAPPFATVEVRGGTNAMLAFATV